MTIINFQLTTEEAEDLQSFLQYLMWHIEDRLKDVHGTPDAFLYEKHLLGRLKSVNSFLRLLRDALAATDQEGGEE